MLPLYIRYVYIYIHILRNFLFFSFALLSLSLSPSLASLFLFVASKFVDDFDVDFCARVCTCLGKGDFFSLFVFRVFKGKDV